MENQGKNNGFKKSKFMVNNKGYQEWTNTFSRKTSLWDDKLSMLEPEKQELIRKFLNQIETNGQDKRCCGNSPGKTHLETLCIGTSPVRRPVSATPSKLKTTKKRHGAEMS